MIGPIEEIAVNYEQTLDVCNKIDESEVRDARFQTNPAIILPSFYFTN
jgi:hypothetical protein